MSEKHNTDTNEILLARIDERTKRLEDDMFGLKEQLTSKFVTKDEFAPVKAIAYTLVSVVCLTVLAALVTIVIK